MQEMRKRRPGEIDVCPQCRERLSVFLFTGACGRVLWIAGVVRRPRKLLLMTGPSFAPCGAEETRYSGQCF